MLEDLRCENHPERAAIETCEVCGKALCGYCLYYTDDGQRLCEQHAQQAKNSGVRVIPPAVYAEGIIPSQAIANQQQQYNVKPKGAMDRRQPYYQGNNHDLNAFIAMMLGLVGLGACCGLIYCLPFLAVLLGVLGFVNANDAVDPRRTRQQSIIAILSGGVLVLAAVGCIGFYMFSFASLGAVGSSSGSSYIFPTYTFTYTVPNTSTIPPKMTKPAPQITATPEMTE